MELYRKHRPKSLDEVCGQPVAVKQLSAFLAKGNVPHAIMFTGASGTGKTTLARILADALGCPPVTGGYDYAEWDVADCRGIDSIRTLKGHADYSPMNGRAKVTILDEFQAQTKDAQAAMLKLLEEANSKTYYFLCTTDPGKILKAIQTRCTKISLENLSDDAIRKHLARIAVAEGIVVSDRVLDKIVRASGGSARDAAVWLEQVAGLKKEEDQLATVDSPDEVGKTLAQLLFSGGAWPDVVKALKEVEKVTKPESLRHAVLGYAKALICVGGFKGARAAEVIRLFQMDTFASGWPSIYWYSWEVTSKKN